MLNFDMDRILQSVTIVEKRFLHIGTLSARLDSDHFISRLSGNFKAEVVHHGGTEQECR